MRTLPLLSLLALALLTLPACELLGGDEDDAGLEAGTFHAEVTGAQTATLEGTAHVAPDPLAAFEGRPGVAFRLTSGWIEPPPDSLFQSDPIWQELDSLWAPLDSLAGLPLGIERGVFFSLPHAAPPPEGTHALAPSTGMPDPTFGDRCVLATSFGELEIPMAYVPIDGRVTVEHSDDRRVRGHFTMTAVVPLPEHRRGQPTDTIRVEGTFHAVPGRSMW